MAKKYVDDNITYIESDIEKIQVKSGMYISYNGSKGALHLAKEVINNGIDEIVNSRSPGTTVSVIFEEAANKVTVIDDGRGIPFDKVKISCTKIQAGSKFTRDSEIDDIDAITFSAGENGVGNTAVNALSDMMVFNIHRENKKGTFEFRRGQLTSETIVDSKKGDPPHGTTVSFIPSEEYLGKCKINHKELEEWINGISYLIDSKYTLTYSYLKKDSNIFKDKVYNHENGVGDLLQDTVKKLLFDPIVVNFKGYYTTNESGEVDFVDAKKGVKYSGEPMIIQCAFTINPDVHTDEDDHYISFCDYINTIDHGVHVNACKTAWCQLVTKMTNDALTETEAKKFTATFDDSRSGLFMAVNLRCLKPQFASQTKEKISNDELFKPIRKIIYHKLLNYFRDNPGVIKKITTFVKQNMKARMEVTKIHKSEYKPIDSLTENTLRCFNPANGNGYKELFIVEGGSAKGPLVKARDARTQALFSLKGVPKNSYGLKLVELLSNQEFKYLVKVLGCGIGKDFNINHLKYDKIIIFTDSDIDGFRIASMLCTFFITQYPEIITSGKLYKAVAPLYLIDDPKHPFILNKIEYYTYFADKLVKVMKLYDSKGVQYTNAEFKKLIIDNNQYINALEALINYYSVNPDILEFVVEYKTDKITDAKFKSLLKKKFPEMDFDGSVIKGVYDGAYQYLTLDHTFDIRSERLKTLIANNGTNVFSFDDGKMVMKNVSLGKVLKYAKRYMPVIDQRYKGLGEMEAPVLWKSSLNPATRELIQLTSENIEKELARFQILHGKDSDERKKLMEEYILNIDDIDT